MKEELTREEVRKYAVFAVDKDLKRFATALLEEMDKPKVWDGSPEDAKTAEVCFFNNLYCDSGRADMVYTRELPKTRARKNAEELYKILCFQRTGKTDCINAIESALEKYAAELKGKE